MKYTSIIIIVLIALIVNQANGQDPYLQDASPEVENAARILVERYTPKLVLSSKQLLPFEVKVTEFLIRKSEVDRLTGLSVKEKLKLLRKVSKQETAEMQNILSRMQLREYRKIKKEIQPIYIVVE